MKLSTFNTTNAQRYTRTEPFVSFMKTGLILLNKPAALLLGVEPGDQVQFLQDTENPTDWYIEKVNEDGFTLRRNAAGGLILNSLPIKKIMFESVGYDAAQGKVTIGEQVQMGKRILYTLVTAKLKANTAI